MHKSNPEGNIPGRTSPPAIPLPTPSPWGSLRNFVFLKTCDCIPGPGSINFVKLHYQMVATAWPTPILSWENKQKVIDVHVCPFKHDRRESSFGKNWIICGSYSICASVCRLWWKSLLLVWIQWRLTSGVGPMLENLNFPIHQDTMVQELLSLSLKEFKMLRYQCKVYIYYALKFCPTHVLF